MMNDAEYEKKKSAMITGGRILSKILPEIRAACEVGKKTIEIDALATKLIKQNGGQISFSRVSGYSWATCISINEVIVHGVPSNTQLNRGDVLKLDIGVYYDGYHVDYGDTFVVGEEADPKTQLFLDTGKKTLDTIINLSHEGQHIGVISDTIFRKIEGAGYKIVYELTGHTVGRELHEEPLIPGYLEKPVFKTPKLESGTAYALEIIYSIDDHNIEYCKSDGWSLCTTTGNLNACFENSVFIDGDNTIVLVK